MLFNSVEFAIFLPIVFLLYWYVTYKNLKAQNLLIVAASFFFYGWWDWRFLLLLVFSSLVDFIVSLKMAANQHAPGKRKALLFVSIFLNLGLLGFFKYFNFFAESFADAFTLLGRPIEVSRLNIILPVGISFYTFQVLSYTIDVYRKKLEPAKDIIAFLAFVSFFPQLVAGPIERATNLLPQFYRHRIFDNGKAIDGMRQILWGLFKKIVIADNCAMYANEIFANSGDYSGSTLLVGAIFFAFQIYGDFSGYSDIAIGTARLFGFELMRNFAFPYFSRDIAEFWRRWHISLSTWFRDYLYIPLGGSQGGNWKKIRNIFIIFLVSGFWHGANWTFIAWGFINACFFLPLMLLKRNRENLDLVAQGKLLPNFRELFQIGATFFITLIAWVFFRSDSIYNAFLYLSGMFSSSLLTKPEIFSIELFLLILLLIAVEWLQRGKQHALEFEQVQIPRLLRWGVYYFLVFAIFWFGGRQQEFIYFQF